MSVVFIPLSPFAYQLSSRMLFDLIHYFNYREKCLFLFLFFLLSQKVHLSYNVDKPSPCISLASRAGLGQISELLNLFRRY